MKFAIKHLLLILVFFNCLNITYAEEPAPDTIAVADNLPTLALPKVEVSKPKRILKPENRKVDLHAILFDPSTMADAPENSQEMTASELAKYKIQEALHGEVSSVSTKGLLEDTMRMTLVEGPIKSISPWVDCNTAFTDSWNGASYQNTLYGFNFFDVGINGKMRDDKTVFKVMISPVKSIEGNTYFQSLFADNYVMTKISKNNKILIGNTWVPNGIESRESPLTIPFFARSQISRTYGTVRAIGVRFSGDYSLAEYQIGGYSSERFLKDFFPGPEVAGVFSIKPLGKTDGRYGKITMGGSLDAGNSDSRFFVAGSHLSYEYKRLKAFFEYATADGSNGSTGFSANASEGFYGTLAYRITPRLQALIRYDQFDPNKDKANDRRTEYTAGINYFIKGQALKLMLNYVYYTVENGTYGCRITTGTQIVL